MGKQQPYRNRRKGDRTSRGPRILRATELSWLEDTGHDEERPQCRADCVEGPRPCPWVSCSWHLYLDALSNDRIRLNFPDKEVHEMDHCCTLDIADQGGMPAEHMGPFFNVCRERIRQTYDVALSKVQEAFKRMRRKEVG